MSDCAGLFAFSRPLTDDRYPALRRLMDMKKALVATHACPPLYAPLADSLPSSIIRALSPSRFDVILIAPTGTWDETAALPIRELASDPAFVFLWVGRGDQDGLERGRECLAKWGFRRAEDIVWVRRGAVGSGSGDPAATDSKPEGKRVHAPGTGGLFASQKEHCLMGIKGTVRRSIDTRFAHCNVDTDVMIWDDSLGE